MNGDNFEYKNSVTKSHELSKSWQNFFVNVPKNYLSSTEFCTDFGLKQQLIQSPFLSIIAYEMTW